jgi:hypothetical protein
MQVRWCAWIGVQRLHEKDGASLVHLSIGV